MKTIRDLLSSKKFVTALVAALVAVVSATQGVMTWSEAIMAVLACAAVYVGAQGAADFGKSAELVRADAAVKVAKATNGKNPVEKAKALAELKP